MDIINYHIYIYLIRTNCECIIEILFLPKSTDSIRVAMMPYIRELYQRTSCISPANYPVIFDGPNTLMLSYMYIGNVVNIYCVVKNCVSGFAQAGFKLPGKFDNVIWLTVVYSATGTGLLYSHKICFWHKICLFSIEPCMSCLLCVKTIEHMLKVKVEVIKNIKTTIWAIAFEPEVVDISGWLQNVRTVLLRHMTSNKAYGLLIDLKIGTHIDWTYTTVQSRLSS